VLARLPDYPTRTGLRVTPVVGLVTPPLEPAPDPREVEEVFQVPLGFLLDRLLRHTVREARHLRRHGRHGRQPLSTSLMEWPHGALRKCRSGSHDAGC